MRFEKRLWCYSCRKTTLVPEGDAVIKDTHLAVGAGVILVYDSIEKDFTQTIFIGTCALMYS